MSILNKCHRDLNFTAPLLREIKAYVKWTTDSEKEERMQFIDELPERLKNKVSVYIFEQFRNVNFLNLCADKEEFVRWISTKLVENQVLAETMIQ